MSNDPYTDGYRTAEELASETGYSGPTIRDIAKKLNIPQVVLPGDTRQRYTPQDSQKIRDEAKRRQSRRKPDQRS